MIPVPKYLEKISKINKSHNKKGWLYLDVVCPCGCNNFSVYENEIEKTKEELEYEKQRAKFEIRHPFSCEYGTLKDGKDYVYKSYLFGLFIDKVEIKNFDCTKIIKIKCLNCEKEYILFDSRFNGYDSTFEEDKYKDIQYKFKEKSFKKSKNEINNIVISIENDPSIEEFKENSGLENVTLDEYSNSFGWIEITGQTVDGKKKEIFSCETQ